ncbi:MAG: hypothetical protein GYB68_05670 [Chloroflexi bacterium]|nr:hypothetical protein [Chloroflexota bacterium]
MKNYTKPILLAVALVLVAWGLPPLEDANAQDDRIFNSRFGLVDAYENAPVAFQSGAGWEAFELRWDLLQPSSASEWNAEAIPEERFSNARNANREMVGILVGTPAWATGGPAGSGVPSGLFQPPSDSSNVWASFVRQAVNYYTARGVNRWVIWNEPDTATWSGSIEEYYQLVKTAYIVAKEANPNALIHLGGITSRDPGWFNQLAIVAAGDPTAAPNDFYFDVASLHVYYDAERIHDLTANTYFAMSQQGIPLKPVWVNEMNARPAVDPLAYPGPTDFNSNPNITMALQASFVVQAYALGFSAGADRLAVYRLVDDFTLDDQEAFGLVREDVRPGPPTPPIRLPRANWQAGDLRAASMSKLTH